MEPIELKDDFWWILSYRRYLKQKLDNYFREEYPIVKFTPHELETPSNSMILHLLIEETHPHQRHLYRTACHGFSYEQLQINLFPHYLLPLLLPSPVNSVVCQLDISRDQQKEVGPSCTAIIIIILSYSVVDGSVLCASQ